MNVIVARRNIQRYRNLLRYELNEPDRKVLLELLSEEEAKVYDAPHRPCLARSS